MDAMARKAINTREYAVAVNALLIVDSGLLSIKQTRYFDYFFYLQYYSWAV
jgi:hypothetical protein